MTVTWNGATITGPVLIFQDELVTPMDGTVICRSENQAQVGWHFASGALLSTASTTNHFRQRRTSSSTTPSVSRLTTNRPDEANTSAAANGLWTCRLSASISTAVPVGIYARGGGEEFLREVSGYLSIMTSRSHSRKSYTNQRRLLIVPNDIICKVLACTIHAILTVKLPQNFTNHNHFTDITQSVTFLPQKCTFYTLFVVRKSTSSII